jgi:hypothetical protein
MGSKNEILFEDIINNSSMNLDSWKDRVERSGLELFQSRCRGTNENYFPSNFPTRNAVGQDVCS